MARFTPRTTEREIALCMVGHKRERVLGRVGRAVDAAARDLAREAAQLENSGGREAAGPNVSFVEHSSRLKLLRLTLATWSTWSAVGNLTSRAGEL